MPVRGLRQTVRGLPPFAPAYAHYTRRLEAFVNDLRGLMTVSDLAAVTGLSWDTVKHIVKRALEKDYGHPRLKDLRHLSIDEIYLWRQKKFYTLVIDLESGRIVWVAKGAEALRKILAGAASEQGPYRRRDDGPEGGLLGGSGREPAGGGGGV